MLSSRDLVSRDQAGDVKAGTGDGFMVPCTDAASRVDDPPRREPMQARVVDDPDGECPQPPSARFPVWKPRYLDGGAFPLDRQAATCQ
jgi:hypothetical protein